MVCMNSANSCQDAYCDKFVVRFCGTNALCFAEICNELKNSKGEDLDFSYALQTLVSQEEKIPGLPPGGGIYAK